MIEAAIEHAENYTGTVINEAKYEVHFDDYVQDYEFTITPIQEINAVGYDDGTGTEQPLTESMYELLPVDKFAYKLHFTDVAALPQFTSGTRVKAYITAGYPDGEVPKAIRNAIKLILGNLYEVRQDGMWKMPTRAENLLAKYRFYY